MAYLTTAQRTQFEEEGYVVVEDLFDPERVLDPVIAEYEGVLDRLADELYAAGTIASTYNDLPFSDRLCQIYAESGKVHAQYFDFSLPQHGVTHDTPFWTGPAVFNVLRHDGLLDAVESLIGPEIYSNPVQHVRLKPPEHLTPKDPKTGQIQLGATPWHQDNGVVTEDADETEIITVWFPLIDATEEMGCLVVVPRGHRQGLLTHCPSGAGLHIPDELFDPNQGVPLPMRRGSALFMTRRTLHSSLSNNSNQVRWSFDLRYNPLGQPTGRGAFPGFVARSKAQPDSELRDAGSWTELWREARRALAEGDTPKFNRWDATAPVCA
ncbi:MAG: phytanoyl-CoA dioxygenase family protein [Thermomicrobiales bacterium]